MKTICQINEALVYMLFLEMLISLIGFYLFYKLNIKKKLRFKLYSILSIPFICFIFAILSYSNFRYSIILFFQVILFYAFTILTYRYNNRIIKEKHEFFILLNYLTSIKNSLIWIVDKHENDVIFYNEGVKDLLGNKDKEIYNFEDFIENIIDDELKRKIKEIDTDKTKSFIDIKPCQFKNYKKFLVSKKTLISKVYKKTFDVYIIDFITDNILERFLMKKSCKFKKRFANLIQEFLECRDCEKNS